MSEKVSGYSLIVLGLGIMFYSAFQIVLVFTNHANPLPIFNISSSVSDTKSASSSASELDLNSLLANPQDLKSLSALSSSGQLSMPKMDLIPPKALNQVLNMTTYFFLMTFMLGFGYKIAMLGINLVRPIVVKLRAKEVEVLNASVNPQEEAQPTPASS